MRSVHLRVTHTASGPSCLLSVRGSDGQASAAREERRHSDSSRGQGDADARGPETCALSASTAFADGLCNRHRPSRLPVSPAQRSKYCYTERDSHAALWPSSG